MKNFLIGSLFLLAIWSCTNLQKNKNNQNGSFNDTLAVTKLLVKEIRKDLESKANVDSINEHWSGKLCYIDYRVDKFIENSQSIYMTFGDFNGDSLNDAIATIEYNTGGNRPEFKKLAVERTSEGYQIISELPLFGYRYVEVGSIKDGLLELTGKAWTNSDPMCCPSIVKNFKVKLVEKTFEIVDENSENINDQNATEFENAKLVADSIKQKFDLIKHKMYKLTNHEWYEGGFSETCYFDSLYRLVYVERKEVSGDDARTSGFTIYRSDRKILSYFYGGFPNTEFIWINKHFYLREFRSDNTITYNMREEADNDQRNNSIDNIKKISKQEFRYNSDSSYYYREVSEGDKDAFDYKERKICIDSLLFVHLFGDK